MKKMLILAAAFACIAGSAVAQNVKTTKKTSPFAKQLALSDQQQAKLNEVREEKKKEMEALNKSNPMKQWNEKKKALNKKYEDKQMSVLTKEQQEKAKKLKKKNAMASRAHTARRAPANVGRGLPGRGFAPARPGMAPNRMAPNRMAPSRMAPGRMAPGRAPVAIPRRAPIAQQRMAPGRNVVRPGKATRNMAGKRPGVRAGRMAPQRGRMAAKAPNTFSLQRSPIQNVQTRLKLTDAQKSNLTKSRDSHKAKVEAIKKNDKLSKDQKKKEMKELSKKHKEEMNSILTKEQQEKMKSIKKKSRRR